MDNVDMVRGIVIVTATVEETLLQGEEGHVAIEIVTWDCLGGTFRPVILIMMTAVIDNCTLFMIFCMPEWDYWLEETHADF